MPFEIKIYDPNVLPAKKRPLVKKLKTNKFNNFITRLEELNLIIQGFKENYQWDEKGLKEEEKKRINNNNNNSNNNSNNYSNNNNNSNNYSNNYSNNNSNKINEWNEFELIIYEDTLKTKGKIKSYFEFIIQQIHYFNKDPSNYEMNNTFLDKIEEFETFLKFSMNKDIIQASFKSLSWLENGHVISTIIEDGIQIYLKEIDPLNIWLTGDQLITLFHLSNMRYTSLKFCLILLFLSYSQDTKSNVQSNWQLMKLYYDKVKKCLPQIYTQPSIFGLLCLIILGCFEMRYYKILKFKHRITDAIRLGNILGLNDLTYDIKYHDLDDIKLNLDKRKIWEALKLIGYTLVTSLSIKIVELIKLDFNLLPIYKQYSKEPFIVSLPQTCPKAYPFHGKTINHLPFFYETLPMILSWIHQLKSDYLKSTSKQYRTQFPIKHIHIPYLDILARSKVLYFQLNEPLNIFFSKLQAHLNNLDNHFKQKNWLTYGPVFAILTYLTMLGYPLAIETELMHLISFVNVSDTAEKWFNNEFWKWNW